MLTNIINRDNISLRDIILGGDYMRGWLIELRGNQTQKQIAKECGISQNFYSWIETGERTPSVPVAKEIAKALDFDWTKFFENDERHIAKTG